MSAIRIETERLILRPLEPRDVDAHIEMMGDPKVAGFLAPGGTPQSKDDRWRQFASYLGHWQMRGFGFFAVDEKETGEWVGRVGPWMPEGWPGLECGWGVRPVHWGKGYAPEAAIALLMVPMPPRTKPQPPAPSCSPMTWCRMT